jgi:RNA polymerase sigma-70 factor (ECF subfamily)
LERQLARAGDGDGRRVEATQEPANSRCRNLSLRWQLQRKARLPAKKFSLQTATFLYLSQSDSAVMTDAELVQQILNGNSNAFRFLVAKHQRLVLHVVGRIVQRQEDIEDICQEVFMKVYSKIGKFRGEAKLSTWIARIAYNTSISHLRKEDRDELSYDERPALVAGETDESTHHQSIETAEIKNYLMMKIEELPVQYRTVLTLFHLEEFSYREIEEITGMPEGTIKSYLSRARKILKEKLEKVAEIEKTNIFTEYA